MTDKQTPEDPKQTLRNLVLEYTGAPAAADASPKQMREAIEATQAFKAAFAKWKDTGLALDELIYRTVPDQKVPAWLVNPDYTKKFKGVVNGRGGQFLLPNGKMHFVDYGAAVPGNPPLLTEFVFGGTISKVLSDNPPTTTYEVRGKPTQAPHGLPPPPTGLGNALQKLWRYVAAKGAIAGESFDQEFAVLSISENPDDIRYFPAEGEKKAKLSYVAIDGEGTHVTVTDDPANAARQLRLSESASVARWKDKLKGRSISALGILSVLKKCSDYEFGEGVLASVASQQGTRIVAGTKDPAKRALNLKDLYNKDSNPTPSIPVGEKFVYKMESYQKDGREIWNAYVRLDMERDTSGRPMPPTLDCVVRVGAKGTFNEGAFVTYIGAETEGASQSARQLLLAE